MADVLVRFAGPWPWGDDEVEVCHGLNDAAHVVEEHWDACLGAGREALRRMSARTASGFVAAIRAGLVGKLPILHDERDGNVAVAYIEVIRT